MNNRQNTKIVILSFTSIDAKISEKKCVFVVKQTSNIFNVRL